MKMKSLANQSETNTNIHEVMLKLKHEGTAFAGKSKNQPVLIYRHKRWHFILLGFLVDQQFHSKRGISSINFMSSARARKYITEELVFCKIIHPDEVLPHFVDELAAKVLPTAADYRPLLQAKLVQLVGGFTTDTLTLASIDQNTTDDLVTHLDEIMKTSRMGPFLHFDQYYTVFPNG